jgi:hypothetical protein
VWGLKDGKLTYEHQVSTGTTSDYVTVSSILPAGADELLIGWADANVTGTTYGIDLVDSFFPANYAGRLDSPAYQVGTAYSPATYDKMDIILAKPLENLDGLRVSYRKSLADGFTSIGTYTSNDHPGTVAIKAPAFIADASTLQVRVELNSFNGSDTPELKAIILS